MVGKVRFGLAETSLNLTDFKPCEHLVENAKSGASYMLAFLAVVFLSNIGRALLRPYNQPRMVAETLVS